MINYWKADCKRVFRRIPRILMMLVLVAVFNYLLFKASQQDGWNSVQFLNTIEGFAVIYIICAGFIEFLYIYASDLKARTMQVGIAMGMKRRRVIGTKYLDMAILSFVDLLFFMITLLIVGTATGASLQAYQIKDVIILFVEIWVSIQAYAGFGTLVTLFMQNAPLGGFVYFLLSARIVHQGFAYVFGLKLVRSLKLTNYLLTDSISKFKAQLLVGSLDLPSIILILIYVVGIFLIACRVFKDKELDL